MEIFWRLHGSYFHWHWPWTQLLSLQYAIFLSVNLGTFPFFKRLYFFSDIYCLAYKFIQFSPKYFVLFDANTSKFFLIISPPPSFSDLSNLKQDLRFDIFSHQRNVIETTLMLDVVAWGCDLSSWEVETGGLRHSNHPQLTVGSRPAWATWDLVAKQKEGMKAEERLFGRRKWVSGRAMSYKYDEALNMYTYENPFVKLIYTNLFWDRVSCSPGSLFSFMRKLKTSWLLCTCVLYVSVCVWHSFVYTYMVAIGWHINHLIFFLCPCVSGERKRGNRDRQKRVYMGVEDLSSGPICLHGEPSYRLEPSSHSAVSPRQCLIEPRACPFGWTGCSAHTRISLTPCPCAGISDAHHHALSSGAHRYMANAFPPGLCAQPRDFC